MQQVDLSDAILRAPTHAEHDRRHARHQRRKRSALLLIALPWLTGCPAPEIFRPDVDLPVLAEDAVGLFYLDQLPYMKVALDRDGVTWTLSTELSEDDPWVRHPGPVVDAAVALATTRWNNSKLEGRSKERFVEDSELYFKLPRDHPSSIVAEVLRSDLVELIGIRHLSFVVRVPSGEQRLVVTSPDPNRQLGTGDPISISSSSHADLESLLRELADRANDARLTAMTIDGVPVAVGGGREWVR